MKWSYCSISDFTDSEYDNIYSLLSPSRKEHIDRFKKKEDGKRSLAGELLVRKLVLDEYGISDAIVETESNGRPVLNYSGLYVSIAHCEDMVVCAVSNETVGIDVERIKPIDLRLSQYVCVKEEKDYLFGKDPMPKNSGYCEDQNVLRRFYEIWTAKEAWFKKLGTGITDLKSINILTLNRHTFYIDDYLIQIIS